MTSTSIFEPAHVADLYNDLRRANTEQAKKERFLQYLSTAFAKDKGAQTLISAVALGAERIVANITRGAKLAKGRADTQTDTIIIEWEKDLTKTGEHAREQLEEYLEGNWRSGQEYRFVLLATDGIRWRRYAPDWSEVDFGKLHIGRNFKLREIRRFDLSPDRFSDFPFFLDEILFTSHLRPATLENIQNDFGDTSPAFINSMAVLQGCAQAIGRKSELKVAFEQWRRFLSIAYGRFDDSPTMFLVHTYLSVFAKFIAYAVITKKPIRDDGTMVSILTGSVFDRLNIERFVEDDFFHWVARDTYFKQLRPMFRALTQQLHQYDFSDVREDILKGVYQELIDLETRHALGEYYTPDWLCERIVDELPIARESTFLDPACGSGSFLRAIIARMRDEFPDLGAEVLAEHVVGIDIHPLSVLVAKTTVLLSLGDRVTAAQKPVTLHIYLANSLLVPRGTADLFESSFQIAVDNKSYVLNIKGIEGADDFDKLVSFCEETVSQYKEQIERGRFVRLLRSELPARSGSELPRQLYDVYRGMKTAHTEERNSIWKFILQNSYKPIFLMNRFDFVVGNPPWLTYSAVSNGEYQSLLRQLSNDYAVTPASAANMPHLEIAAIFLAHAVNYFLKPHGLLAFVLPRSFLSADHHDNTRSGVVESMRLVKVWDLGGVAPLFRVPSCVLFAVRSSKGQADRKGPPAGLPGLSVSGRLPRPQIHLADAKRFLTQAPQRWYLSQLQGKRRSARTALTTRPIVALAGGNAYESRFTQGATIVPRNFFFVTVDQDIPKGGSLETRTTTFRTADTADREAKQPWKGQRLSGRSEGKLLFRTAISRNVIPFALVDPPLVLLPVVESKGANGGKKFTVLTAEGLREKGFRFGSAWFHEAERRWERDRTDLNKANMTTLAQYLDWQSKLSEQNPDAKFLVLYTSSATDASAVVIDRRSFDHPFIVDHKTYWCECQDENEAHYLAAYVNSGYANDLIKAFQSRGLFGPRDVHKLIVMLPFPAYRKNEQLHSNLADLGKSCSTFAANFAKAGKLENLEPRALGAARTQLREQLASKLSAINDIVEKLSTKVSRARAAKGRRRRSGAASGELFS